MGSLAYVALRGSGDLATIDVDAHQLVQTRHVCAEPRGIAFDKTQNQIVVACGEGEVVTLSASGQAEVSRVFVARDLRDVVLRPDGVWISEFRSTAIWRVTTSTGGQPVVEEVAKPLPTGVFQVGNQNPMLEPRVAWRMLPMPGGGVIVSHQLSLLGPIPSPPQSYYGQTTYNPAGTVRAGMSLVAADGTVVAGPALSTISMPVDLAVSPTGTFYAMADPTLSTVVTRPLPKLPSDIPTPSSSAVGVPSPVALAYTPAGLLLVQTTEPRLRIYTPGPNGGLIAIATVVLQGDPLQDNGFRLFHTATPSGIACAHCHPEGREDGHVWNFVGEGEHRTQSLAGGVLATAPLHWSGAFCGLDELMALVFVQRMGGNFDDFAPTNAGAIVQLGAWLNSVRAPAPQPQVEPGDVVAGKALFQARGCMECHSGNRYTDGKNYDVGTGDTLQVPSLIGVSARLPVMHSGCAHTLEQRFEPACGGIKHGDALHLSPQEIHQLVAFLSSL